MLASALWVMLAAAPAARTWHVGVVHKEDLSGKKAKGKAPDASYNTAALLTESFTLAVTEAGPTRPRAVELTMVKGTLGKVTIVDERGEPFVRLERPPLDLRLRTGLIRYLDRLVVEDPLRPAMSNCEAPSKEATEKWLHKTMAWITASQLDELSLREVKHKCTAGKKGVTHEVSLVVEAPRGRHGIDLRLKGKVVVDPAVWATTWSLAGPMKVIFDKKSLGVPMDGTFTSSFALFQK
jgi:hypothetical protein